ncbi:hypothetical protein ALPO108162_03855 [Alicyclobacillus pomorum]
MFSDLQNSNEQDVFKWIRTVSSTFLILNPPIGRPKALGLGDDISRQEFFRRRHLIPFHPRIDTRYRRGGECVRISNEFQTYTLSRKQLLQWPILLKQIWSQIEQAEIKIVDITRTQDHLVIVYRRLRR